VWGLRICQPPGGGLGQSIAKLLVEAQGGRQTCFRIDLPLAAKRPGGLKKPI
jgi:hypothetical protein